MAELLLKKGMSVIVFDNLSTGLKDNVKLLERYKRCTFIKADITDGNALAAAIAECDAVFHFAAVVSVPYSVENPDICFSVNVAGFENIIAALRGTTKPLFYASSAAVYGNRSDKEKRREEEPPMPMSPYAASKAINEDTGRRRLEYLEDTDFLALDSSTYMGRVKTRAAHTPRLYRKFAIVCAAARIP